MVRADLQHLRKMWVMLCSWSISQGTPQQGHVKNHLLDQSLKTVLVRSCHPSALLLSSWDVVTKRKQFCLVDDGHSEFFIFYLH